MSYITKTYLAPILIIIIICILAVLMMSGVDSCTDSIWNDGVCSNCEIRYDLKGISRGLKYYMCPECGQEVQRFFN